MSADLKRRLARLIGIGFAAVLLIAAEPWQVVAVNRISLEGNLKDGGEFEVRVESEEPKNASGTYFGAVGRPRSVVSDVVVNVAGKKMSFPEVAYNDLANPLLQTVSITSQLSGPVRLRFTGGEGDASYEVEYLMQGGRLAQRTISYFEAAPNGEKSRVVKTTTF